MNSKSGTKRLLLFSGITLAFVITWIVMGYGPSSKHVGIGLGFESLENAALFGDSFGYVNSFFSALAFVGIVATLLLQWHEIGETKRDQEELRNAAVMQADSMFLANFLEIERNLLTEQHELERLWQSPYKTGEASIRDATLRQKEEIIERLKRSFDLMQPRAEAVMQKIGAFSDGDECRPQ